MALSKATEAMDGAAAPDAGALDWRNSPVLIEQMRLMLANVRDSFIFSVPAIFVMTWLLYNQRKSRVFMVWGGLALALQLLRAWHAHQLLKGDLAKRLPTRIAWEAAVLNMLVGAAWGALYWTSTDQTTFFESFLVNAAIFLAVTNAVSMLSPFLPTFIAFIVTLSAVIYLRRTGLVGNSPDGLPPGAPILMAVVLTAHARNLAKGVRRTIAIRFENLNLMARVREEARKAAEAHEVANAANGAKTQFLAAASHDLRQPMHALGLFLEVMERGELSGPQRQVLGNARAVANASSAMLNALLDYSRIDAGAVQPQVRAFHLQPILHKIENELAAQANAKGLVYRSRETHVAVLSDPSLVEMMLRNLVTNAIRYTAKGGVLVASRVRGDALWLEVWDTGIGIAPSQQAEIFREFHQLDNAERDRERGLGLGLAIVDGMARTLGHSLRLVSQAGRGSVFRLALPIAHVAVVADSAEDGSAPTWKLHLQVLVIDDDAAVRAGMRGLLQNWGCQCEVVESLEEALQSVQTRRPDFIVSDYRLRAGATGAQAIAVLRAVLAKTSGDTTPREVPALLVTGDTAPDRLREAIATGIPLLHKPVSPTELWRRMSSAPFTTDAIPESAARR